MTKPKPKSKWNDPKKKYPSPKTIAAQDRERAEENYRNSRGKPLAKIIKVPILKDAPHVPPMVNV